MLIIARLHAEPHNPAARAFHPAQTFLIYCIHTAIGSPLDRETRVQDGLTQIHNPLAVQGERIRMEQKMPDAESIHTFSELLHNALNITEPRFPATLRRAQDTAQRYHGTKNTLERAALRSKDRGHRVSRLRPNVPPILQQVPCWKRQGIQIQQLCRRRIPYDRAIAAPGHSGNFLDRHPGGVGSHDPFRFTPKHVVDRLVIGEHALIEKVDGFTFETHQDLGIPGFDFPGEVQVLIQGGRCTCVNDTIRGKRTHILPKTLHPSPDNRIIDETNLMPRSPQQGRHISQVQGRKDRTNCLIRHPGLAPIVPAIQTAGRNEEKYPGHRLALYRQLIKS